MLKETFEKAQAVNKKIAMTELMKNKIEMTQSLSELFRTDFTASYGREVDELFRDEVLKSVNQKLEQLKKEFESL